MTVHNYDCKAIRSLQELNIEDQSSYFDVIISDILFDGIAPLDFVFQIQEIILHDTLIIVTNMGQKRIREEMLLSQKVSGFFAVPFDMDRVATLISG